MDQGLERSKVPEVTLVFWIIKILATTRGETGGDAVSMSMDLGYAVSSFIFIGIFIITVGAQIAVKKFHPSLYWLVVVATTTAGTTMADFADRSLGIGYPGGASLLFALLMASLAIWYWSAGSISVNTVSTPKIETFYWVAILFSQTLGTALGDWMADTNGLGYEGGALVFAEARALRLPTVLVTEADDTPLAKLADVCVVIPRGRPGQMALHGATFVGLEALVLSLAAAKPKAALASLENLNRLRRATEAQGRSAK